MKLASINIVFQEVPDEISLALSFSGCKNNCHNCHSAYLKDDIGDEIDAHILRDIIVSKIEKEPITCILFFGGDHEPHILVDTIKLLKAEHPYLKYALYSGQTIIDDELSGILDYIKLGPYIEEFGGLRSKTTNQRMYKNTPNGLIDITYRFREF